MPDWTGQLVVEGLERRYVVHRPDDLGESTPPLFLALHGRRLTLSEWRRISHLDTIADRHGFVVVYPEGHQLTWNDGRGGTPAARLGVDDVGFLGKLLDRVVPEAGADPERVAVAGLSNGGAMSHRIALELSDRISVMASIAGLMARGLASVKPTHAVSALLVHGTQDPFTPMSGGRSWRGILVSLVTGPRGLGGPTQLSFAESAERWRVINGSGHFVAHARCAGNKDDQTTVEQLESRNGQGGTAVSQWIVGGGGHTWPGGPRMPPLGRTTRHFDAGEVIWSFASSHFQPAAARRLPTSGRVTRSSG